MVRWEPAALLRVDLRIRSLSLLCYAARKTSGALPFARRRKANPSLVGDGARERPVDIPKGSCSARLSDAKAAAREACEEGGVTGTLRSRPVGKYTQRKSEGHHGLPARR